jgi:RNA polymerase sigma-70 factor (ECF subfamily)
MSLTVTAPLPLGCAIARPRGTPARMTTPGATPDATPPEQDPGAEHIRLAADMARGDKAALGRLYDLLGRPLYSLAYRITGDAAEAQDVVQDVFVQLWNKAADYQPSRGSYFSWAATLTRNRALDRVRMHKRRGEIIRESADDIQPARDGDGLDSGDALWLREKAGAVRAALTSLPPEQRAAIELAFFSGLTQQQIAERLGDPLGTVKARIRRGLLRLRDALSTRL